MDKQYKKKNTFEYIQIPKEKQSSTIDIEQNTIEYVSQDFLEAKNWSFLSVSKINIIHKLKAYDNVKSIYGKSYRGLLTGLNDAFILENLLSENEQIKLIYEGKDLTKWSSPNSIKKLIFFPRGFTKERYGDNIDEVNALSSMRKDFPELMQVLLPFEERAKKRYDQGDFWWELRNCAYYDLFEKEKIVFPNLQNSNKFCFDSKNVYINAPAVFLSTDDKALLAILNSKLVWFFLTSVCVVRSGGYIEVKPQYFEQIPIALPETTIKNKLEDLSKHQITKFDSFHSLRDKFLKRLKDNFDLDKLSKKLEAFYAHDFKTFASELGKKKVTLSLLQQDEWEPYFENYQTELLELQSKIDATDKEIDAMVYELYGLNEAEVAVVES